MRFLTTSASSANELMSCMRKWYFAKELHLVPKTANESMEKGQEMHRLLEYYYEGKRVAREYGFRFSESDNYDSCLAYARAILLPKFEIEPKEFEAVLLAFRRYLEHYAADDWIPIETEQPFSKLLFFRDDTSDREGLTVLFEGKTDLTIYNPKLRKKVIVDHKTGERDKQPGGMSNQYRGYAWAKETDTIVINKILYQKEVKFKRYPLSMDKELVDEWYHSMVHWIQYFDDQHRAFENGTPWVLAFPPNYTSCDKYSGCIFYQICDAVPRTREYLINREFKVKLPTETVLPQETANEQH